MKEIMARVGTVVLINDNVYQVTLQVEGQTFAAGQYLLINLPSGESVPYSIGSAPHELPEVTLYILVSDATSLAHKVIEHLKAHTDVAIKMPGGDCDLNHPVFDEDWDHILLVAGGTGFSQMKSLFDSLVMQGYPGRVSLYWGVRTVKDIFQQAWLAQASLPENFSINLVVNDADAQWSGRQGWLYEAICEDHPDLSNSVVFMSGSVGMVYGTLDKLSDKGLPQAQCFSDVFAYAPRPANPVL